MNKRSSYWSLGVTLWCSVMLPGMQTDGSAATLANRYSFNETAGTTAVDSIGSRNGTLMNNAMFTGGGSAYLGSLGVLSSDTTGDYIVLPEGLVSTLGPVTVEVWYTPTHNTVASGDWNRIFDFFTSNSHFFLRSGNATSGLRGDITTASSSLGLAGPAVPDGAESHVVWTSDPVTGFARIYVNGVEAAFATGFTNTPAMLGNTTNWLGRSKFAADAYLAASYNEFRIYSGALNPLEAAASFQSGTENPSASYGSLSSIALVLPSSVLVGNSEQSLVLAAATSLTNKAVRVTFEPGLTYESSAPSIVSVDAQGKITGNAPGNATVTATYTLGGVTKTSSKNVAVVSAPAVLMHRYSFDQEMSVDAIDSIRGSNAVVALSGIQSGGQVALDGTSLSYVNLPAQLISTNTIANNAVTFETWVTFPSTNANWANLFAFGNTVAGLGGNYIFFSPHSGNSDYRLVGTSTQPGYSNSGEQAATVSGNLDYRTNLHVVGVVNFGRDQLAIYVNGVLMAQNTAFTRELSQVINNYSYLGKSTYDADPTLIASIDEFRIYDGALNAAQIAAAYQKHGPGTTDITPGAFQSIAMNAPASLGVGWQAKISARGNWQNATNVNLLGDLDLKLTSSDTNVVTVSAAGVVTAVAPGNAVLTANYQGNSSTQNVTVKEEPATMVHRYSFNATTGDVVKDLVGTADGRVMAGTNTLGVINATWSEGQLMINTDLTKGAADTFVDLPDGIISVLTNGATFEFWVTSYSTDFQGRLLEIGSLPGPPFPSAPNLFINRGGRVDWSTGGYEVGGLSSGVKTHVVVAYNDVLNQAKTYYNGNQVGASAPDAADLSLTSINDTNIWLGRSIYSAPITPQYYDPYLKAGYDEFRIYSGTMTPAQIAASYAAGPNPATTAPALTSVVSNGNITLSWPTTATGYKLHSSAVLGAGASWVEVPGSVTTVGSEFQMTVQVSGNSLFFRLQK